MSLKSLREALCREQSGGGWPDAIASAVDVLIDMIDRHRPLGPDGKHGDRHTPNYPKCEVGPQTHGPKTDVRAWWPACPRFEAGGEW